MARRNNNPQFMMMIPPQGQPEESRPPEPDITVPARIHVAMGFLDMCNHKMQDRAAVSESQIQVVEGKQLSEEEINTQATACHLLSKYLAGELKNLDDWEKVKLNSLKNKGKKKKQTPHRHSLVVRCLACGGNGCHVCEGGGGMLINVIGPAQLTKPPAPAPTLPPKLPSPKKKKN